MVWLYVNVNIQKRKSNSEPNVGFCYFILFGNLTCRIEHLKHEPHAVNIYLLNSYLIVNTQCQLGKSTIRCYVLLTVHLDILCNENQPDTLSILNLFRQSTSTCFGHVYCLSSGGIHSICTAIDTCYTFKVTGCWPG
jgi:hypothetical protein